MGFFITQLLIALSLLTPQAFGIQDTTPIILILGMVALAAGTPYAFTSKALRLPQPYLAFCWVLTFATSLIPIYLGGAAYAFRNQFPNLAACILVMITAKRLSYLKWMSYVFCGICVFVITMAIHDEHAGVIGSNYVLTEMVDPNTAATVTQRIMGLGTLHDPNDFGQMLVCTLPLLWLRWKRGSHLWNFLLTIVPAAYLLVGVYLTRSRGTLVALLVLIAFAFKDRLGPVVSTALGFLVTVVLVASGVTGGRGMTTDDGSRIGLWAQCMQAFRMHPFIGVGAGGVPDLTDNGLTAHNSFVLSFTETGLFGYFFFIAMLLCCWLTLKNLLRASDQETRARSKETKDLRNATSQWSRSSATTAAVPTLVANTSGAAAMAYPPAMARAMGSGAPFAAAAESGINRGVATAPEPVALYLTGRAADEPRDAQLDHAAFCVRLSLVAVLTSCMFLSRTYSLQVYLLVAMVTVLAALSPKKVVPSWGTIIKYTPIVMAGSIFAIYLIIRLHGGH